MAPQPDGAQPFPALAHEDSSRTTQIRLVALDLKIENLSPGLGNGAVAQSKSLSLGPFVMAPAIESPFNTSAPNFEEGVQRKGAGAKGPKAKILDAVHIAVKPLQAISV